MSRLALAAVAGLAVAGCGRIGFAPIDAGPLDAPAEDAPRPDAPLDAPLDAPAIDAPTSDAPDGSCVPEPLDPCTAIPRLREAPSIDGVIEPCLATSEIVPAGWTDPAPIPDGVRARAAIAWRSDGVYLYVEVDDPAIHAPAAADEPYCGDAIEIYVDDDGTFAVESEYDDPGTIQAIVGAPESETGTSTHAQRWVFGLPSIPWAASRFAMVGRPGGYALEALVQADDLRMPAWTLAAGGRIGLDLAVDVSTPDGATTPDPIDCGSRLGQYFLRVVPPAGPDCGEPFCDSRAFCTPTLL